MAPSVRGAGHGGRRVGHVPRAAPGLSVRRRGRCGRVPGADRRGRRRRNGRLLRPDRGRRGVVGPAGHRRRRAAGRGVARAPADCRGPAPHGGAPAAFPCHVHRRGVEQRRLNTYLDEGKDS